MPERRACSALTMGLVLLSAAGCGSKPELLPMGQVVGVVTVDGKPVPGAVVEFNPQQAPVAAQGKKRVASGGSSGITDENGKYFLRFDNEREGAVIGVHSVRVREQPQPDPEDRPQKPGRIPVRYALGGGLTFEVKAGSNQYDLDLRTR